jgi:REP element-mobilizing transposase RayT
MNFYRRKLPHWQPPNATYFITIRLANSLPKHRIKLLKEERKRLQGRRGRSEDEDSIDDWINRKIFAKYEQLLDSGEGGPVWLEKSSVAELVADAIHYRDQKEFDLISYCIMPNHLHLVLEMEEKGKNEVMPLTNMLRRFKSYTALKANRLLGRQGAFWQAESYDHVVRNNKELQRIIKYVIYNPVKAKLVEKWSDWPHTYLKPEFEQKL